MVLGIYVKIGYVFLEGDEVFHGSYYLEDGRGKGDKSEQSHLVSLTNVSGVDPVWVGG